MHKGFHLYQQMYTSFCKKVKEKNPIDKSPFGVLVCLATISTWQNWKGHTPFGQLCFVSSAVSKPWLKNFFLMFPITHLQHYGSSFNSAQFPLIKQLKLVRISNKLIKKQILLLSFNCLWCLLAIILSVFNGSLHRSPKTEDIYGFYHGRAFKNLHLKWTK